jgi:hypothetical protein
MTNETMTIMALGSALCISLIIHLIQGHRLDQRDGAIKRLEREKILGPMGHRDKTPKDY